MTDTHTPLVVDDIAPTDVYIGTLEIRSVGNSKNLFPAIRFSHHFSSQPSEVPYSYRAVIQIAEKIGAIVEERDIDLPATPSEAIDEQVRAADAALVAQTEEGNDTIH